MDILLIDEKIKNNLNSIDKKFYFLDTSHIIDKYKKILSKPILRSNEKESRGRGLPKTPHKREKSDIVKEYIKIVNFKYKKAFYHKNDILEIVTPKEPPPSHKIETLKEYYEIVKKLKKASKTKKILISHESEDNFIKKDKYHSMIDIEEILYYEPEPESNKMICKNCNGIDFEKNEDFIACSECGYLTTRINFIFTSSDVKRVTTRRLAGSLRPLASRRIYKLKKNVYNKDGN